ncbi:NAD-dependent epimerase/dehydratase family protein [Methylocapsa palsarum]|uniref:Uronate dehydrogenase n=1 Tax=Methylocapsa palsarum TaxID=1612308 RepID=A0A1I3YVF2_9HYPH|nr:NAD(P)-dependent oxidoreductase [Methylocapsa palsarum]SFK35339.1 uronate dehydrogenase [Methylocapsa palsarum]
MVTKHLPTVLITGASGILGQKLRRHFSSLGWRLKLIDIDDFGDPAVIKADLSVRDEAWTRHCIGVDAIIHLAAQTRPDAPWDAVARSNVAATQNVYEAARQGPRRVVFASSNWVMAGYRYRDGKLTTDLPPAPINPYGVSKLIGESLGRFYHERWGLSTICFRIGYCLPGENLPGQWMDLGFWGQLMWLSDRDLCQAMERAVLVDDVGFAILNLVSDNPGMRWDIDATRTLIGYRPLDGAIPVLPLRTRMREAIASLARRNFSFANTWRPPYEAVDFAAPADLSQSSPERCDLNGHR